MVIVVAVIPGADAVSALLDEPDELDFDEPEPLRTAPGGDHRQG